MTPNLAPPLRLRDSTVAARRLWRRRYGRWTNAKMAPSSAFHETENSLPLRTLTSPAHPRWHPGRVLQYQLPQCHRWPQTGLLALWVLGRCEQPTPPPSPSPCTRSPALARGVEGVATSNTAATAEAAAASEAVADVTPALGALVASMAIFTTRWTASTILVNVAKRSAGLIAEQSHSETSAVVRAPKFSK